MESVKVNLISTTREGSKKDLSELVQVDIQGGVNKERVLGDVKAFFDQYRVCISRENVNDKIVAWCYDRGSKGRRQIMINAYNSGQTAGVDLTWIERDEAQAPSDNPILFERVDSSRGRVNVIYGSKDAMYFVHVNSS